MSNSTKIEKVLEVLSQNKQKWLYFSLQQKITYLEKIQDNLMLYAKQWVEVCCRAKEGNLHTDVIGQELLLGPVIVMRQIKFYLRALKYNGKPPYLKLYTRENEQLAIKVMPENLRERVLWKSFQAEVWIQKNQSPSQGNLYENKKLTGELSLVLGAGNVSSIAPLDILYKLFVEGKVCIVKLNPVNEYLNEIFNKVFANLVADGFISFVRGGADLGEYLCNHNLVNDIHITGSHVTHDKIVWGEGSSEEIKLRKFSQQTKLNKSISSELGCVTPFILVPGVWSDAELIYQAKQIASAVTNNASFNCNAAKLLVTCAGWQQRELFLNYLRNELRQAQARRAYYPGAWERYASFLRHYPQAEILGESKPNCIPWTLIANVTNHEFALQNEAFCGVICEYPLNAENVPDFLHRAVDFCNQKVWGTLSCNLIIDPLTNKIFKQEIETALENLHYGAISINCWSALIYALCATTWGAFPGATLDNIQSGIGSVHNGLLIDHPEKSILRAPFTQKITPPWFYDNKNIEEIGYALLDYEYSGGVIPFMKLVKAALKG